MIISTLSLYTVACTYIMLVLGTQALRSNYIMSKLNSGYDTSTNFLKVLGQILIFFVHRTGFFFPRLIHKYLHFRFVAFTL